jgi:hypothetical protein
VTVTDTLRAALATVRNNPDAVAELERADAERARLAAAEAKRRDDAASKLVKLLPERTAAIVADFDALEREAVRQAAEGLARLQLERELGLAPASPFDPVPVRLPRGRVDAARIRLAESLTIPWLGRTGGQAQADQSRADMDARMAPARARKAAEAAAVAEASAGALAAADQRRAAHVARIAEQKRAAGIK